MAFSCIFTFSFNQNVLHTVKKSQEDVANSAINSIINRSRQDTRFLNNSISNLLENIAFDQLLAKAKPYDQAIVKHLFPFLLQNRQFERVVVFTGDYRFDYSLESSLDFHYQETNLLKIQNYINDHAIPVEQNLFYFPEHIDNTNNYQSAHEKISSRLFFPITRSWDDTSAMLLFIYRPDYMAATFEKFISSDTLFSVNLENNDLLLNVLYFDLNPDTIIEINPAMAYTDNYFRFSLVLSLIVLTLSLLLGIKRSHNLSDVYATFLYNIDQYAKHQDPASFSSAKSTPPSIVNRVLSFFLIGCLLPLTLIALLLFAGKSIVVQKIQTNQCIQAADNISQEMEHVYKYFIRAASQNFHSDYTPILFREFDYTIAYEDYQALINRYINLKTVISQLHNAAFFNQARDNIYSSVYFDTINYNYFNQYDTVMMESANGNFVPFIFTANEDKTGIFYAGKTNYETYDYVYTHKITSYTIIALDFSDLIDLNQVKNNFDINFYSNYSESDFQLDENTTINRSKLHSRNTSLLRLRNPAANIISTPVDSMSAYLIIVSEINFIRSALFNSQSILLLFTVSLGVVLLAIFFIYYRMALRPVKIIERSLEKLYEQKILQTKNPIKPRNEIAMLLNEFNRLVTRVEQLAYENYQAKIREKEMELLENKAQLKALQHQINPHLLYNTLEAIKWMAVQHKANNIYNMLMALSELYKNALAKENEFITTIEEEIKTVKNYVYLQQQRFPDLFTINYDIDSSILDLNIPKMILQPLVENSIEHGFIEYENDGIINITIKKGIGNVIIIIEDNGCGIDEKKMSSLHEALNNKVSANQGEYLALINVRMRLHLIYGEKSKFVVETNTYNGVKVTITYPIQ